MLAAACLIVVCSVSLAGVAVAQASAVEKLPTRRDEREVHLFNLVSLPPAYLDTFLSLHFGHRHQSLSAQAVEREEEECCQIPGRLGL